MRRIASLITLFLLLAVACPAQALETEYVLENLPRDYRGAFTWHGSESSQELAILIEQLSLSSAGTIIARGNGVYHFQGRITRIKVEAQIAPDSLRFEMWEFSPDGSKDFVTDGLHAGEISEDLQTITATWTRASTGDQGDLLLKAK